MLPVSRPAKTSALPLIQTLPRQRAMLALLLVLTLVHAPLAWAQADALGAVERLMQTGQLVQALARADVELVKTPQDAALRFARGVLLSDLRRPQEAVAVFQQLAQDHPDLPDPPNNLAVLYAAQGRLDEARAALEAALRNDPLHHNARENLGDVYVRLALRLWEGLTPANVTPPVPLGRKLRLTRELIAPPL